MLATIGYEKATPGDFIETLQLSEIDMVVDIRERAQSRRKGFSKTALVELLTSAGIEYLHLKQLGDPKEGREAARNGQYKKFRRIFMTVMATPSAQEALDEIAQLARTNNICLLCYERDHKECHRKIVSDHLEGVLNEKVLHLGVRGSGSTGRVLHINQSAAA